MSRPRVSRTVARTPCSSSAALKASIAAARRALEARLGGVVGNQVDLEGSPRLRAPRPARAPARSGRSRRRASGTPRTRARGAPRASAGRPRARRAAGSARSPASAPSAAPRRRRAATAPAAPAAPRSVRRSMPGIQPTVEIAVRRGLMPTSGRRSQAASTASRFISGSPIPMNTAWLTGSLRRKWSAWSRISEAVRLRPNFIAPGGAEGAGERAARLARQAERAAAVAVAHQHRLDRPPVGGAEERLLGAVPGQRLVLQLERRERAPRPAAARAAPAGRLVMSS